MAEKFREHLDKVQETIQEALDSLPDLSNMDTTSDNKLLIPILSSHENTNGAAQIQMTLTNKESCTSNSKTSFAPSGVLSEDERTIAVNNLDSIVCKMIDDSLDEMEESMKNEDE